MVLSPCPAMSNSILCNNEGILYLRCPLDASGYLNLLKQNLKLFASHVALALITLLVLDLEPENLSFFLQIFI